MVDADRKEKTDDCRGDERLPKYNLSFAACNGGRGQKKSLEEIFFQGVRFTFATGDLYFVML